MTHNFLYHILKLLERTKCTLSMLFQTLPYTNHSPKPINNVKWYIIVHVAVNRGLVVYTAL